jgi:hypothetical protein
MRYACPTCPYYSSNLSKVDNTTYYYSVGIMLLRPRTRKGVLQAG